MLQHYNEAFTISQKARIEAESIKDTNLLIKAYTEHGKNCFVVFNEKESKYYLQKALSMTKVLLAEDKLRPKDLMDGYLNLIQLSMRFQKYQEANLYIDSCFTISEQYNFGQLNKAYLKTRKAYLLILNKKYSEALSDLKEVETVFEEIDSMPPNKNAKHYLPVVYSYIGEANRHLKNNTEAEIYFKKSLEGLKKYPFHHSHKPYVLEQYAWLLYETGDFEKAKKQLDESKLLSEQYFSAKTLNDSNFQKVKTRYQNELNGRMQDLIMKSALLAQKEKTIRWFQLLTILFSTVLIFTFLTIRIKKVKRKHMAEMQQHVLKEEQSKELIKLKNRELTESTLKLIEKEELIKQLTEELSKHNSPAKEALFKQISSNSENMWDDFNKRFKAVNQDFYSKLAHKFPTLTANELKICALIKLNFTSKEMAHLLGISTGSVDKARYRLRKKLDIERDTNLTSYISTL